MADNQLSTAQDNASFSSITQIISQTDVFNDIGVDDEIKTVSLTEPSYPTAADGSHRLEKKDAAFFKVKTLSFDDDYPRREAFENVLFAIDNPDMNFVYILEGGDKGIDLYLGVVKNNSRKNTLYPSDYSQNLKSAFEGNFNGSELTSIVGDSLDKLLKISPKTYKRAGFLVGIPSVNEDSNDASDVDFQGIDRLINSMLGKKNWRVVIICEPVQKKSVREYQNYVYDIYNRLAVCAKMNLQQQTNQTYGESVNHNSTDGYNHNHTVTHGKNKQTNISDSRGTQSSSSNSNHTTGSSAGENWGDSDSNGTNHSESNGTGKNWGSGSSTSLSFEIVNKRVQETMAYIDDELLKRQKIGLSKGLYKTSLLYMAGNNQDLTCLKNTLMSLFQGDGSSFSPLTSIPIPEESLQRTNILSIYQNASVLSDNIQPDVPALFCRPYENGQLGLSTYLTASEISLIAGLPRIEVPGITLKKAVNFGLNEKGINETEPVITLGKIVQRGRELDIDFKLKNKSLSKHCFIAGVTGSGKTTTCHRLLGGFRKPYLVIEPAKTEYRTLINQDKELVVFTVGNEALAPFRLNPFELIPGEIISSHIDMVKATFTSAFPMDGSMPQLLEEAMIKIYEDKGWNLATNKNTIYGDRAFDRGVDSFPILSDLLTAMPEIVDSKNFGSRLGSEYLGSLVSRLSNLTKGSKGFMLNCSHSIDFDYLVSNNVVLELEELKSPEDKALVMGFVISMVSSMIKHKHKQDKNFTHLTLIEEAHRLLSKPDVGDTGAKKAAVETFADLLAEVRKYGEGLIIVDQIPNKLASEVLKNTNTKIIHKILARDDKETVGDTMLMDDKQKEFLSALPVGQAVIFSENTDSPVNVKIKRISDTEEAEIEDSVVEERFLAKKALFGSNAYVKKEIYELDTLLKGIVISMANLVYEGSQVMELFNKITSLAEEYQQTEDEIFDELISYNLRGGRNPEQDKCVLSELFSDLALLAKEHEQILFRHNTALLAIKNSYI